MSSNNLAASTWSVWYFFISFLFIESFRSLCHLLPRLGPDGPVGPALVSLIIFTSKWSLKLSLIFLHIWKKGRFMIRSNAKLCWKFRLNNPSKFILKGQLISTENCSQFKFHGMQREGVLLLALYRRDNSPLKTTPLHLKQLIRIL